MAMRTGRLPLLLGAGISALLYGSVSATGTRSDIASPNDRASIVALANRINQNGHQGAGSNLAELSNPFAPSGFAGDGASPTPSTATKPEAVTNASESDLISDALNRLHASGVMIIDGEPRLVIGTDRLPKGTVITVSDATTGKVFEVELAAIGRTSYTVRFKGTEITRPIARIR
jgi:hypothetical protein